MHTLQDSTSPAHKYFQSWKGAGPKDPFTGGNRDFYRHVLQESKISQLNGAVFSATRYVWHMFYYHLVPTGDVFIF